MGTSDPEPSSHAYDAYRFEEFEVRVQSDTLLRNNERVRIQELPFRLLLVLLEHPGTVLSNDELGRRLGGAEWYVELGSLRVAVTKLRDALGDNASSPRFIRTVSGQGYKFIAPVTPVFQAPSVAEASVQLSTLEKPPVKFPARFPVLENTVRGKRFRASGRFRAVIFALSAILLLGAAAFLFFWARSRPVAGENDTVVVGGFTNNTSNQALDQTMSAAFLVKIQESPYLNLLLDRKFRELIPNPDQATLNDELNACRTLHGQVLLAGRLTGAAPDYQVALLAWRCQDGHLLTEEKAKAQSDTEILPALNHASEQMRKRLGEPDSSLQKFNVPLAQATTNSLAALRAFTQGEEKRLQGLESASISDYKFAVDLDPQFALAYARLGTIYYNTGEFALSRENYQKAFDLRERTTDRERLYITANYYLCSTGEIQRAIEAYEFWRKIYPRDIAPVNNLAIQYLLIGQPEKALVLARIGIRMDPTTNILYGTWSQAYLQSGDYAGLNALCNGPLGRNNNAAVVFHVNCFQGAFAQGNEAAMQREMTWAKGQPEEGLLLQEAAIVALYRGQSAQAWKLFREANESAAQNNMQEAAASAILNMAGYQADMGFQQQARVEAAKAIDSTSGSAMLMGFAAVPLARSGDLQKAQELIARASALEPQNALLNQSVLASARAMMALERHEPAAAIAAMETSRPYDFNDFMFLAPAYYRGIAYLENKQPAQAIAEFDRLIAHRALFPSSPYFLLAELERGRALQLSGDISGARASYKKLDDAWKNADADFPPLRELHGYEHQLATRP